ncbi:MAG: hypothetical protein HYT08_00370 [Candidatus Levybacteria bacterium]|nr:hypothetical protein [Candidatus Levybacteria bacterium]
MKIIINSKKSYLDEHCSRCGSEKRVARKWKEEIATLTGTTVLKHTQIVCMNEECQMEADELLLKEAQKRQDAKMKKQANDELRKVNILLAASKIRKNAPEINS